MTHPITTPAPSPVSDSGLPDTGVTAPHPLGAHIQSVWSIAPDAAAIEYRGETTTWAEIRNLATSIAEIVSRSSSPPRVGIALHNTPAHVAALLGVLVAGGTVVVINPARGDERARQDIAALRLPILIASAADLARLSPEDPELIRITLPADSSTPVACPAEMPTTSEGPVTSASTERVAIEMLTSGTTGPPKRVPITYDMLAHSVLGERDTRRGAPTSLSSGVAIVNAPLVHIGGVYRILQSVLAARTFVLLDRFVLDEWAQAVRTHRPRAVSLVPTAIRMILQSDLPPEDLASLQVVTSGTAPLSADDADAFTERFGAPVLTSYAATEFGGGVAGWTLADHRRFWATKRGSAGRATGGSQLRVVDHDGHEVGPDETGLLEVKPGQLGPDTPWLSTTDLARLDADGFLWILGRADQAIIRGGFKISPDTVRNAIEGHPDVSGAAVVGVDHSRLGQVPVAMVSPRPEHTVTSEEVMRFLDDKLARYEIPMRVLVVAEIPRTPSGKADLGAVRAAFTTGSDAAGSNTAGSNSTGSGGR